MNILLIVCIISLAYSVIGVTYQSTITFLTDIDDVNDIYQLQFVRRYHAGRTFLKYDTLSAEFNMTRIAKMVVAITHLDDC